MPSSSDSNCFMISYWTIIAVLQIGTYNEKMCNSDNRVLLKIYAIDRTAVAATVKTRAAEVAVNDTTRVSFPS